MTIEVYSKDNCVDCVKTKNFLKSKNIDFIEYQIGKDISVDELKQKAPNIKKAPVIFKDKEFIGSFSEIYNMYK